MTALDSVIAIPRLVEIDRVDLSVPPGQVWQRVRHAALAHRRRPGRSSRCEPSSIDPTRRRVRRAASTSMT